MNDRERGLRRERLLELVRTQPVDDGVDGLGADLQRLCRGARVSMASSGVAVQLVTAGAISGVLAASDSRARNWADLAFVAGEGPSHVAVRTRRPVTAPDLRDGSRDQWPGYATAVGDSGLAAVLAFPLSLGAVVLGVLEVFDDKPRGLTEDDLTSGVTLAMIGTEMMLDGSRPAEADLGPALEFRAEVAQAQGMVMVDLGVSLADALVRLRAHSFATGEPLLDLSRRVIDGFVLPDRDGARPRMDPGVEES